MDAVEFLKEYKRMCGQIACESCPLHSDGGCDVPIGVPKSLNFRKYVEAVEQWAKDHPAKTRQSEFLKMFPNALCDDDGVSSIFPCNIDRTAKRGCLTKTCRNCRRENGWRCKRCG